MEINIEELSLEEKIGQMLIIGMDTNYITDRIKNMIQKYKIGNKYIATVVVLIPANKIIYVYIISLKLKFS